MLNVNTLKNTKVDFTNEVFHHDLGGEMSNRTGLGRRECCRVTQNIHIVETVGLESVVICFNITDFIHSYTGFDKVAGTDIRRNRYQE